MIPTALVLIGLGLQVGGFVNRMFGWVLVVTAGVMLTVYMLTQNERPTRRIAGEQSEAELLRAKRAKAEGNFHHLYMRYRELYQQFEKAPDEVSYEQTVEDFNNWMKDCVRVINENFGLGEAQAFVELGPRNAVDIISNNPQRSGYRWNDKTDYLQRLKMYGSRLAEFLKRTSSV